MTKRYRAVAVGIYDGMKSWKARPGDLPDNPDVLAAPSYYKAGYVFGTLFQAVLAVIALAAAHGVTT